MVRWCVPKTDFEYVFTEDRFPDVGGSQAEPRQGSAQGSGHPYHHGHTRVPGRRGTTCLRGRYYWRGGGRFRGAVWSRLLYSRRAFPLCRSLWGVTGAFSDVSRSVRNAQERAAPRQCSTTSDLNQPHSRHSCIPGGISLVVQHSPIAETATFLLHFLS